MNTLVIGIGALGGLIAGRLRATGSRVWLATRDSESAAILKKSGIRVKGVGGPLAVEVDAAAPFAEYDGQARFDLIILATKARDALNLAPRLPNLLLPSGMLLPIQNGGVPQLLAESLGDCVLGGLSNLGATMESTGVYEQRNAGHLLIGELSGGASKRTERVAQWLRRAVDVRVTSNFRGAVWSKIVINCSVTTIGAVAGETMRGYVALPGGQELFTRVYDEALSVALATGAQPERMFVDPVPPGWKGRSVPGKAHDAWVDQVLQAYGDIKPSMLQDFERGRTTEIDFINGYVVDCGRRLGVPTPVNEAIVNRVREITQGRASPSSAHLGFILRLSAGA
jgi:2-dehydropantoate 2-reductase